MLKILLEQGHDVTTTVRSQEKADTIKSFHPNAKLDFKIVPDIAADGAFDEAVKIDGLEAVIHTASPVCQPFYWFISFGCRFCTIKCVQTANAYSSIST